MRSLISALATAAIIGVGCLGTGGQASAAPIAMQQQIGTMAEGLVPVEKTQYVYAGRNYCWYGDGWRGPGWYWCGYAWRHGYGWGGGHGWRGWHHGGRPGGAHVHVRHGRHGGHGHGGHGHGGHGHHGGHGGHGGHGHHGGHGGHRR